MTRDSSGLELRSDPTALAPERLLVFEVRGSISSFANAIRNVPGLELIDEEELTEDGDKKPVAYLVVPDMAALRNIESLWRRWLSGQEMELGFTPWRDVFFTLRDLRPWGPEDRVSEPERKILHDEIAGLDDAALVALEIELVFRKNEDAARTFCDQTIQFVNRSGGRVVREARIADIAYHAILVELPVVEIRRIVELDSGGLSAFDPVQNIRPQSLAEISGLGDKTPSEAIPEGRPSNETILALIDGVPIALHPLLARHLSVDDIFDLEPSTPVAKRRHGTAMSSLIIHGDRNNHESALNRKIHVIPVLGNEDRFPSDQLIVDMIYRAVVSMREGEEPTAPHVLIVNISLGNRRRPFHGLLSPWARLLDRLSYRFGILFLVSAGNVSDAFSIPEFTTRTAFEDAGVSKKSVATIFAIDALKAERKIISPAETVNGLTIGASNRDWVSDAERRSASLNIDPYSGLLNANPSSALGPGFANSVKPEIIFPSGREPLQVIANGASIVVRPPEKAMRSAGLKVAAPPFQGIEAAEGFSNGTSAATALASRTAHRIHDALEAEYGDEFLSMSSIQRAVLLKALLIHPASWPEDTATRIKEAIGPADGHQHVKQKDNIRRFLGYGTYDPEDAIACASDRATFWAIGELGEKQSIPITVPIPVVYGNKARPHSISATLAWFTPVNPGRQGYRSVRLKLLEPEGLGGLGVAAKKTQPDQNQNSRGTVSTRCWIGDKNAVVGAADNFMFNVQRSPDTGGSIDGAAVFALAVTLQMPGVTEIYQQVRERLRPTIAPRV